MWQNYEVITSNMVEDRSLNQASISMLSALLFGFNSVILNFFCGGSFVGSGMMVLFMGIAM